MDISGIRYSAVLQQELLATAASGHLHFKHLKSQQVFK